MDNKEFIERLSTLTGRSHEDVSRLIEALSIVICDASAAQAQVSLPGLGQFRTELENEQTVTADDGKRYLLPPSVKIIFNASKSLISAINAR